MRMLAMAALCLDMMLAGCHGSTLDAIYPGSLGHEPPPAANLPTGDCPTPAAADWNTCTQ